MCYIEMCFRVTMLGQYRINKQTNKQTNYLMKWFCTFVTVNLLRLFNVGYVHWHAFLDNYDF